MRLLERIRAALETHFWTWALALTVLFFAGSVGTDLRRPIWSDEFLTLTVAQQKTFPDIVNAIKEGCDGSPPLYATIVHFILPAAGNKELAVRIPSTVGFCGMILCLLGFCRRRLPASYALLVTLFAVYESLYYASEGRVYGLVLGCASAALLTWQAAAEGIRRAFTIPLLALSLAAMVALHYYAIFFLGPIFLGELWRWRESRKLDGAVLIAVLPAFAVLAIHYPLILASKPAQEHVWSPAAFSQVRPFYDILFGDILYFLFAGLIFFGVFSKGPATDARSLKTHEWVVVGALSVVAPIIILIAKYTTHAFVDRYAIWEAVGLAVLAGAILHKTTGGDQAAGLLLLGFLLALSTVREIRRVTMAPTLNTAEIQEELQRIPDGTEPIVVPNVHAFLELVNYGEARIRGRLVFPASRALDLRYLGNDSIPLCLLAVGHRAPIRVQDTDAFLAAFPRFLIAATAVDYLPWLLAKEGYRVTPVRMARATPTILEAEAPAGLRLGMQKK
jgi:hypothetical protein